MNKVYTKRQYTSVFPHMLDIFEFVVDLVSRKYSYFSGRGSDGSGRK